MYKLGNLDIRSKVVLAPMAGITSFGYRKFMSQFGLGYVVTEMVSDMGLIYGNKETKSYIEFEKLNCPTGVQLFGNSPENMAKAVQIAEKLNENIDFFDVNMGCPVNKVVDTGAGSALMKNPKLCGDIIRAMKAVTNKPITVKIRLGFEKDNLTFLEVIKEVSEAGAALVTIHPRTRKEMYAGQPHWELVKDLRKKIYIPLVVSGNIYTVDDAIKALEITGADAVMVARGGVGNPTLIKNINSYFEGREIVKTDLDSQIKYCYELARDLIDEKGEALAMRVYRGICTKFFDGFPNSKQLKNRLTLELNNFDDLTRLLEEYRSWYLSYISEQQS